MGHIKDLQKVILGHREGNPSAPKVAEQLRLKEAYLPLEAPGKFLRVSFNGMR